ncbi:cytochrome P450 [Micromonospora sp. CPCC 205371]|nr:cytochrome P450 [Micromonospora sp. CPCC 205371]
MVVTSAPLIKKARAYGLRVRAQGLVRLQAARGDPVARILVRPAGVDPYPLYEEIRARGTVSRSTLGMFVTASHRVVSAVLREPTFGVPGFPLRGPLPHPGQESVMNTNPPKHTKLRRLVTPWFTSRALERYTDRVRDIFTNRLDELADRGSFDVVRDYAMPATIRVICELFELPEAAYQRFATWGSVLTVTLDRMSTGRDRRRARAAVADMNAYLSDVFARRRKAPGCDVMSALAGAESDGDEVWRRELVATAGFLMLAGFETTVSTIGTGSLLLLDEPARREGLAGRPQAGYAFVDEVLRYDPPVQYTIRRPQRATTVDGVEIPGGAHVLLLLAGANRDPEVFDQPDRFDPARPNNREHLSFSSGPHYCLGAGLARMEAAIALTVLFERFPELRRDGAPVRHGLRKLRGLRSLPVRAL